MFLDRWGVEVESAFPLGKTGLAGAALKEPALTHAVASTGVRVPWPRLPKSTQRWLWLLPTEILVQDNLS
jgi:hypothetical protein